MKTKMNLKMKLLVSFITIGVVCSGAIAVLSFQKAKTALSDKAFQQLESVRDIKAASIKSYFGTIRDQVITMSEDKMVVDAMRGFSQHFRSFREQNFISDQELKKLKKSLKSYYTVDYATEYKSQNDGTAPNVNAVFEALDADAVAFQYYFIKDNSHPLGSKHLLDELSGDSDYNRLHATMHPPIKHFLEKFGFYDIFLIDTETGDIVYSVFKELDYATSLIDGPYADTNFAEAFRKANTLDDPNDFVLLDFKQYMPSYHAPASFIASPIFDGDERLGVLIFQMPIDRVNQIMGERAGLGETGETYLIGNDLLMRSDSYLDPENHSVVSSFRRPETGKVETAAATVALEGKSGNDIIIDYNGNPVLSSYAPIEVLGLNWAILSEIDEIEAFAQITSLRNWILLFGTIMMTVIAIMGYYIGKGVADPILVLSKNLSESALQVSSASAEASGASQTLSEASNEQASSIEETSASLEELTGMVNSNVDNAKKSNEIADAVRSSSSKSNEAMSNLIQSMDEIKLSNENIQALVKVIGEIGEKTEVIDEIVFQTKLLSFNASVEAERAGEHGRGFAVVAQEVGNLAQMSGKAALEIKSIVKESIENAEKITSENKVRVEKGAQLVEETSSILKDIEENAKTSSTYATQIFEASKEQETGIKQINIAISQLDKITQKNTATSEQTASSSEELSAQSKSLNDMVGDLLEIITGDRNKADQGDKGKSALSKAMQSFSSKEKAEASVKPASSNLSTVSESSHVAEVTGDDGWDSL